MIPFQKIKTFALYFSMTGVLLSSACGRFVTKDLQIDGNTNIGSGTDQNEPPLPPDRATKETCGRVTVNWYANTEADLAGYKIHYGMNKDNLSEGTVVIPDPKATSGTVGKLFKGVTYYFNLTAYDKSGYESGPSQTLKANIVTCTALNLSLTE